MGGQDVVGVAVEVLRARSAWIAAGISLLTLLGSMGMQAFGIRRVSKDMNVIVRQQLEQQRDKLDRTITEER